MGFLLLLGAGLTIAGCLGDSQDAPTTAPDDPADYVITPAGYYHKDCVYDVGDEATVEDDEVIHADGSVEALPSCTHPSYASREDLEAGIPRRALDDEPGAISDAQVSEPTYNGWVSQDFKRTTSWFRKLGATWSVPTSPSHYGGQTVFLFPGFYPSSGFSIVQPVLQYGPSVAGGGNFWTMASWWCTTTICPHSTLRRVNPGDILDGTVTGSSCTSGGVCTWTITTRDRHTGQSTTLVRRDPRPMKSATTALEVYRLATCSELPSSGAVGFTVNVQNANGSWSTSGWGRQRAPNINPNCNYQESSSGANHTYLFWNP
jgi:hypothetical protein